MSLRKIILLLIFVSFSFSSSITDVEFFAYQIQFLDTPGAIDSLVNSRYDMLILEPTRTESGMESFDTRSMVSRCKASSGLNVDNKIVLAYIDIGEAEEWRTYWQGWWVPPTESERGTPDFMITCDPDGWEGNYPVAYWDARWQDIIVDSDSSILKKAISDGFDGIYMDWVEAYDDINVIAAASEESLDPAEEMIMFIDHIKETAQSINPDFLIVAQNAADLCDDHPEYYSTIDAIAQEDLHYYGEADLAWGNPLCGDIPQDSDYNSYLITKLNTYLAHDIPVFTVEYTLLPDNIEYCYTEDNILGFIPFCTQTPLSRLPDYYPPEYLSVCSEEKSETINIRTFPNPFWKEINISVDDLSKKYIEIFDIFGKRLASKSFSKSFVWEPKNAPYGVYIISIENNQNVISKTITYIK